MHGLPSLAGAAHNEFGGGLRHVVLCDRGEVVNVVLWDGATPFAHPPIRRADASLSAARLLRDDRLAIGERLPPEPGAAASETTS